MRILFWNTNNNDGINPYLVSLVLDNNVDLLIVAEYNADETELETAFKQYGLGLRKCNTVGCNRIKIWSSYVAIEAATQNKYYSMQIINKKYILCCVHLISDLHGDRSEERLALIQEMMSDVKVIENQVSCNKIIIVGDFNEMPYDKGCLNANGCHGLPVLSAEDMPTRTVNDIEYRKFYNPMWNLMGDFSYPPGTYYLNQAKLNNPMWYMLDQIIISKDLIPLFNKTALKIITTCSYGDLMNKNMHPDQDVSDHFPIFCEITSDIFCEE